MKTTITKKLASMMLILALMFTLGALSVIAEDGVTENNNSIEASFYYDEYLNLGVIEVGASDDEAFVQYAFAKESTAEDKIKWYPLIGDTIDVSKYIPKKEGSGGGTVVKLREYNPKTNATSSIKTMRLLAMPDTKELKTAAKTFYNFEKGEFVNTFSKEIEVKFESEAYWILLPKGEKIDAPIEIFPNGATVQVRLAASGSTSSDLTPPSMPIKMKIAAQGKAPTKVSCTDIQVKNPDNSKEKITVKALKGATTKMEASLKSASGEYSWVELKKDIQITELQKLLGTGASGTATVCIRIKATDKKPYSQIAEVQVDFPATTTPVE